MESRTADPRGGGGVQVGPWLRGGVWGRIWGVKKSRLVFVSPFLLRVLSLLEIRVG